MSWRIGISFPAKSFSASSDSQTSTTRKTFSPCPGMWASRPSTGQSAGDSIRLLPPVSRRTDSSYCSCVMPSKTSTTGTATSSFGNRRSLRPLRGGPQCAALLRSRYLTVVVTLEVLFAWLGSVGDVEVTDAVSTAAPFAVGLTVTVIVTVAPAARLPSEHVTMPFAAVQLPWLVVEDA